MQKEVATWNEVKSAREYARDRGLRDPYLAYRQQRSAALNRDIDWQFTFGSWWSIWRDYYHLRGRGTNGLCMARENDEGPYAPGNVYLTTNLGNLRDYQKHCPRAITTRHQQKEKREIEFARARSTNRAFDLQHRSHLSHKANHTSKSTCNYSDDALC